MRGVNPQFLQNKLLLFSEIGDCDCHAKIFLNAFKHYFAKVVKHELSV